MTESMLIYAAEINAIVRIQWGLILVLGFLLLGVLMVNFRLRAKATRATRTAKHVLAKLVLSEKECTRLAEIRRRTERALVKLKAEAA